MNKYEYNPEDILDWQSKSEISTFKGCFKAPPGENVTIKVIPNTWEKSKHASTLLAVNYKIYEKEVQKLQKLQRSGKIKFLEVLNINTTSYLIFSDAKETKFENEEITKQKFMR